MQYACVRIIVGEFDCKTGRVSSCVSDKMDIDRDVHAEVNLPPGDFLVLIEVEWNSNPDKRLVFSSYTDHPLAMTEVPGGGDPVTILDSLLAANKRTEAAHEYEAGITRRQAVVAGYLYFSYENNSSVYFSKFIIYII